MKSILFLFILFSSEAFALSVDHPHFIPFIGESILTVGAGNGHREIEYQSGNVKIDEQIFKFNESHINYIISPWHNLAVGVFASYDFDREYELKFGPGSSRAGEPTVQSSSSGLLDPEILFVYDFQPFKDSWSQQLLLQGNPFDIKEEPRKNFRGGHDIFLEYRFSKKHHNGYMYGELYSHYFGKKHYFLPGDSRLTISEAYTEVGFSIGYLFKKFDKFSFYIDAGFGLSSDYDIVTPEVTKRADKGFITEGKIGLNYFLSKKCFIVTHLVKSTRVYNATNEDINQDIDFEVEAYTLNFDFNYVFGDLKE